jgi:hypothetical protein
LWPNDLAESRFAMHHNILRSALNPAALKPAALKPAALENTARGS